MAGKQLTSTKTHNRTKWEKKISIIKLVKKEKSVERKKSMGWEHKLERELWWAKWAKRSQNMVSLTSQRVHIRYKMARRGNLEKAKGVRKNGPLLTQLCTRNCRALLGGTSRTYQRLHALAPPPRPYSGMQGVPRWSDFGRKREN